MLHINLISYLSQITDQAFDWCVIVFDDTVKGSLVLLIALLFCKFSKKTSAQFRHYLVFLALLTFIALPFFSLLNPLFGKIAPGPRLFPPPQASTLTVSPENRQPVAIIQVPPINNSTLLTNNRAHWPIWLALIWGVGVIAAFFRLIIGFNGMHSFVKQSNQIPGHPSERVLEQISEKMKIRRRIDLKVHPSPIIPITCGLIRPTILLPAVFKLWPEERLRVVLAHELSHVKRFDNLTQCVAGLIVTVFWFNPLSWLALKMLRAYREAACDDLVLNSGILPSTYATHLLETVRSYCLPRWGYNQSVAMASTTKIEKRMVRILDIKCNRKPMSKKWLLYLVITSICLVLPFSFFRLVAATTEVNYPIMANGYYETNPQLKISGDQLEVKIEDQIITGRIEDFPTLWPEKGIRNNITSIFGLRLHPVYKQIKFHSGIDIRSANGTPIVATADGEVISAEFYGGYGNLVMIKHKYFTTLAAQLQKFQVKPGDYVHRGDLIGYSGSSGVCTGPHLHYEIRYGSKNINPQVFLGLSK